MNFAISFPKNSLMFFLLLFANPILIASESDTTKHYLLIVNARGADYAMFSKTFSLTGHAFVSWGTQVGQDAVLIEKTAGFYPHKKANWVDMVLDTMEGHINNNFEANSNKFHVPVQQLIIEVDSANWFTSQQVEKKYKKKAYNLLKFNCISFVNKVVTATRLKHAETKHFALIPVSPLLYLNRISNLNREKVVQTKSLNQLPKEMLKGSVIANSVQEIPTNSIVAN